LLDLKVFELSKVLAERSVELLNILVLLSVLDGLRETRETLHGLLDSLVEPVSPVQGTGNRWQIVGDGSSLVNSVNKSLAFKEDLLHCLQVLFVEFEKSNVLLLKLVLNDGSVEKALEGIEELELSNNGVGVIEALGKD
jgi:hypothetical protein